MPVRKHSRDDVIKAALALLDEQGLNAVSVRAVARRMGVNVNTVSFQVGTKGRLLGLMSDAVLSELSFSDLPADGVDRVKEILRRYRCALLSHRDGARLTAGNVPLEKRTLALVEMLTSALAMAGIPDGQNVKVTWALFYFLLGLTQEQQATENYRGDSEDLTGGLPLSDYPTLLRLGHGVVAVSFDERFEFGIDALTAHVMAQD